MLFRSGTDAAVTMTSDGVKFGCLRLVATMNVDATTSDRGYYFIGNTLAEAFGGNVPAMVTFFVTHNTGVNFNSTPSNHYIHLHRIQQQVV